MTQLTIRGVDERLHKALKEKAEEQGISVNRLALDALRQSVGLVDSQRRHHDLDHLAGTWTEEEYEEFQKALELQRRIEPELWESES
ncbi:FitA-like ribbon-helix-helix domain-containing protein [Caldilinea sp.]|uniref:FitA-like ribbon-helix-helix domain-containing protein n=1 Tax=Caldilinea sp. TaxID=2293560 RepID=UPI0021DEE9DC|nr:toxin-antitoxin system HicB family antitoxin [Caldilinea sp.]GIV69498.1 MAG: hypothetical protein KatS3mg048_2360 [Caldilinea sp.]